MRRIFFLTVCVLLLTGCGAPAAKAGERLPAETAPKEITEEAAEWAAIYAEEPAAVRVLLAHDALCARCTYDPASDDRHTAYGAWNGGAVCDGYAEAFALLMRACGIPVLTVTGTADGIPHAWNLIALGGCWVHIDCTWDDRGDSVSHTYFLCSDAMMRQTHTWDEIKYPQAESCGYRYEEIVQQMLHSSFGK